MVFPSPDPLWVLELIKVIIMFALWALLLIRWMRADRRFYTDIPFLFAWGFFILACAESVDVIFHSELMPYAMDLITYKIRAGLTASSLVFFLFPTARIWISENRLAPPIISLIYLILIQIVIVIAPAEDILLILVMPFMLVVYIGFTASFFLAWLWKRLPDVHGLLMSLGGTVTIIGQISKIILPVLYAEILEVSGLLILWLGLMVKPGYAR
jgi:hypothetical protein